MPIVEADGFKWIIDEDGVDAQLGPHNHEAELEPHLKGLGTFVDVGADVGRWSVRLAKYYGRIYAFEPHVHRQARLKANLALNDIANVEVFAFACSDGIAQSTIGGTGHLGEGAELASLVRMDSLGLGRVDVVKIDVEGHEAHVLRGMTGLLVHEPKLIVEMHHHIYGQEIWDEVMAWADENAYKFTEIAQINGQSYLCGVHHG